VFTEGLSSPAPAGHCANRGKEGGERGKKRASGQGRRNKRSCSEYEEQQAKVGMCKKKNRLARHQRNNRGEMAGKGERTVASERWGTVVRLAKKS